MFIVPTIKIYGILYNGILYTDKRYIVPTIKSTQFHNLKFEKQLI